ncbi:MAG: hypothetical protein ACOCSM_01760 [Bacillota bacterium]
MDEVETRVETINDKEGPITLILLSDETAAKEVYDANVFNALLHVETHLNKEDAHIIVELLDPLNAPLIKDFRIENTIISNKIVSLLLSKLALFPKTADFYETCSPSNLQKKVRTIMRLPSSGPKRHSRHPGPCLLRRPRSSLKVPTVPPIREPSLSVTSGKVSSRSLKGTCMRKKPSP